MQDVIIGDLILTEVLQGFRHDRHFRQARQLLQTFPIVTMVGPQLAIRSAEHYRALRRRGVTVRKTIDVMIGTYCIANNIPLLHADRDFDPMVSTLGLSSGSYRRYQEEIEIPPVQVKRPNKRVFQLSAPQ